MRDFQFPGRSPVRATEAMAATSHPLSTLAAIDMLRAGGNAMDAAVATILALSVTDSVAFCFGGEVPILV